MVDENKPRPSTLDRKPGGKATNISPEEKEALRQLGKNIRAHRVAAGLTQASLAELAGYDAVYLSYLEGGERHPPFVTLYRIAKQLNCTVANLLDDVD